MVDPSWTPDALAVLGRACDWYGGAEAYHRIEVIRLIPKSLSGLVPWLKGNGKSFGLPSAIDIFPRQKRAHFLAYPERGQLGVFVDGALAIQREDGSVVAEASLHRQSFRGLAKNPRWTPLDALYFFGYALTHYHSLPFSLHDARLLGVCRVSSAESAVYVMDVEFDERVVTHCRRQQFFIDDAGRLRRHDYHAEIIGFWACGAHFWNRQTAFDGFPIALERHVQARFGSMTLPVNALHATFADASIVRASSRSA